MNYFVMKPIERAIAIAVPLLKPGRLLDADLVIAASERDSIPYRTVEGVFKGLEVELPVGHWFQDENGKRRSKVRVRWWDAAANTYRKSAINDAAARARLPELLVPESARFGYAASKPVFFGHYWLDGECAPLAPNVACVDYSAGKGGPLVAYRWEGEPALSADRFVSV